MIWNNPWRSLEHWRKGISTSTFDDPRWADIPVKRNGASGRRMRGCESVAVSEAVKCFNHCTIAREGAKTALLCCSIQLTASIGNSNSSSRLWKSHCLWLRCSRAWGCGSLANACISSSFVCFFPFRFHLFYVCWQCAGGCVWRFCNDKFSFELTMIFAWSAFTFERCDWLFLQCFSSSLPPLYVILRVNAFVSAFLIVCDDAVSFYFQIFCSLWFFIFSPVFCVSPCFFCVLATPNSGQAGNPKSGPRHWFPCDTSRNEAAIYVFFLSSQAILWWYQNVALTMCHIWDGICVNLLSWMRICLGVSSVVIFKAVYMAMRWCRF